MAPRLRIATFNLESLDDRAAPGEPSFDARVAALRPQLARLDADVLCLQEVNAQPAAGKHGPRALRALDALLEGTPYAGFHRACTASSAGGPRDVHNLVVLARAPIVASAQYRHQLVAAPVYQRVTAVPPCPAAAPVEWDRPMLYAQVELAAAPRRTLHVINLHLRAPLAAHVEGQKAGPFAWRTAAGWAEGYLLAAIKRAGQALEARLLVDTIFDADPDALIVVAGDLNADAHETPVRVLSADPEDTGNAELAGRQLVPLERAVAEHERFTVVHHGARTMLDHVLTSPALACWGRSVEIHNAQLGDEYEAALRGLKPAGSFHAPVVAEFALPDDAAAVADAQGGTPP